MMIRNNFRELHDGTWMLLRCAEMAFTTGSFFGFALLMHYPVQLKFTPYFWRIVFDPQAIDAAEFTSAYPNEIVKCFADIQALRAQYYDVVSQSLDNTEFYDEVLSLVAGQLYYRDVVTPFVAGFERFFPLSGLRNFMTPEKMNTLLGSEETYCPMGLHTQWQIHFIPRRINGHLQSKSLEYCELVHAIGRCSTNAYRSFCRLCTGYPTLAESSFLDFGVSVFQLEAGEHPANLADGRLQIYADPFERYLYLPKCGFGDFFHCLLEEALQRPEQSWCVAWEDFPLIRGPDAAERVE
jgi:hypothetical protein